MAGNDIYYNTLINHCLFILIGTTYYKVLKCEVNCKLLYILKSCNGSRLIEFSHLNKISQLECRT